MATLRSQSYVSFSKFIASAGLLIVLGAAPAQAVELFNETFNGYTSFPSQIPSGDFVNPGIPEITEGASEYWFAGRFENPDNGTINSDLAVQKIGGGTNQTPCGRFEDDAGLVLCIDTTDMINITLEFDWRTFLAESTDRFVVGYYVGEPGFDTGANRFLDQNGDWSDWTQLMRDSYSNAWQHETFDLPDDAGIIYVAFWLDNGEGDYGKLDNVVVAGDEEIVIPEPASLALFGLGTLAIVAGQRRRA